MNNDIKEILDGLNVVIKQEGSLELDFKECKKILDYITNLQELCNKYEEEHSTTFNYWKQLIKEDYKSKCEKAIEYINLTGYGTDFSMNAEEVDVLFNILKGE